MKVLLFHVSLLDMGVIFPPFIGRSPPSLHTIKILPCSFFSAGNPHDLKLFVHELYCEACKFTTDSWEVHVYMSIY